MKTQQHDDPEADERLAVVYASVPVREFAKGERELEGEAYLTGGYAIRWRIEQSGCHFARLTDLAEIWMPGRLKSVKVQADKGIPYLAATQLFDVAPVPRKWLPADKIPDLNRRLVEPGWILVARSGTDNVGYVVMSYSPHLESVISDDLLRLKPKGDCQIGYVYAFLKSRFGLAILRASQYGSVIKHLEPEHLLDLPVPMILESERERVNEMIGSAFALRDKAYTMAKEAQTVFAEAIGVQPETGISEEGYSVASGNLFNGRRRFDGQYYNPATASVLAAIRDSGKKTESLGSLVEEILLPNRFKRQPAKAGIPFVDSEEVFKINPSFTKRILSEKFTYKYYVKPGWIVMVRSGQTYGLFGSATLATAWYEDKVISEHLIRIIPLNGPNVPRAGYLIVAMNHPDYGRPLVLRSAFGTSVPSLSPGDLAGFPVVRLGPSIEDQIANLYEDATRLRTEADEMENAAVNIVEMAVEKTMPVADYGRQERSNRKQSNRKQA